MRTILWRAKLKYRGKVASGPDLFRWSKYRDVPNEGADKAVAKLNRDASRVRKTPAGGHLFEYKLKV